jgi:hypothetical protein
MDEQQRAVFLISQSVCAMAELFAMRSHDEAQIANGRTQVYTEEAYAKVVDRYGIGHNAAVAWLLGQ